MTDFDKVIDRKNTDSNKWNAMEKVYGTNDLLPMWVADTDFEPPRQVKDALLKRVEHGVFGYAQASDGLFTAVKNWVDKRYHWAISLDWLLPSFGVVSSISFAIQALTQEGDKVMVQTPIYPPFVNTIKTNNRVVVRNPLQLQNQHYEIDFVDFEEKLKSGVKLLLLCSPHNPVGRVWRKDELKKMVALCEKYHVKVVSDEIHADIIYKPNFQTSIGSVNEWAQMNSVTLIAPSKTFNVPGLQSSMIITPNPEIRKQVQTQMNKIFFHQPNLLGSLAMETAYTYGEEWLEELLDYLADNLALAEEFIKKEIPSLHVISPEGTYLVWIDCRELGLTDQKIQDCLIQKGKLALDPGTKYGPAGSGFVRMNIGCPRSTLREGLHRLKNAFA